MTDSEQHFDEMVNLRNARKKGKRKDKKDAIRQSKNEGE